MNNIYIPHKARIASIKQETADIKSFQFELLDPEVRKNFKWKSGQFLILSVFGVGEATFTFANPQTRGEYVECSIKKTGLVTEALHDLEVGDIVAIRGPYGNWFPFEKFKGQNLLFVGGGIGIAAIRSPIEYSLDTRADFKDITILYGGRSPLDICYFDKFDEWQGKKANLVLTADKGSEGWKHKVGFVPAVLKEMKPSRDNCTVITCGPPIMIKFVLKELTDLGFAPEQIVTTLEMKMKCGLGKCGRCNIQQLYVCKDGPVFDYAEIKKLPDEF